VATNTLQKIQPFTLIAYAELVGMKTKKRGDVPTNKPLSSEQMLDGPPVREWILLVGRYATGKSSAIVSVAQWVEMTQPSAKFHVIDTEKKFRSALQGFRGDAPKNISYHACHSMDDAINALATILDTYKLGDWVAVESMGRLWEYAQDLGYRAVTDTGKAEYMQRRRGNKSAVTPKPDELWSVTKGAHDGAFLDLLNQHKDNLNVIMSTTTTKPPKPDAFIKESQDRKAIRVELGIDVGIEGAPRIPNYAETMCFLEQKAGAIACRVLRDNLSSLDDPRQEFDVPDRKSWASTFFPMCREQ
jgi:hypothetical protein